MTVAKANQITTDLTEWLHTLAAWARFLWWMLSGKAKLD